MKEELDRFSKQHPKHRKKLHGYQQFGFGNVLVNTENLVPTFSKIIESKSDVEWAVRESTSDGPNHKQLRNAIILNQLAEVINKLNISNQIETLPIEGNSCLYSSGSTSKLERKHAVIAGSIFLICL